MTTTALKIKSFRGGVNFNDPTAIKDDEVSNVLNMVYDNNGFLSKTQGRTQFGADVGSVSAPVMSLNFYKFGSTRVLAAVCDGKIFRYTEGTAYNNGTFGAIKTGLTAGLRHTWANYKEDSYTTNGTDNYMGIDWATNTVTEYAGVSKGKYLHQANDIAYLTGFTGSSDVEYTASLPANFTSFPNSVPVGPDTNQTNTGLFNVGPIIVCGKQNSLYNVNIATPDFNEISFGGGLKSHYSVAKTSKNNSLFMANDGVRSLAQAASEDIDAEVSDPIVDGWENIFENMDMADKEITAGIYWPKKNRYYLAYKDGGTNNNFIMVYDTRKDIKAATRLNFANVNDFCIYEDSDGEEHLLAADSYVNQIWELEDGWDDDGDPIRAFFDTKDWHFDQPQLLKISDRIDLIGYISEGCELTVSVFINGENDPFTFPVITGSPYANVNNAFKVGSIVGALVGGGTYNTTDETVATFIFHKILPYLEAGRSFKIRVENNQAGARFGINNAIPFVEVMSRDAQYDDYIS